MRVETINLLFLCTGNSCRSQMAEGWAREMARQLPGHIKVEVESAGLEAHGLNPVAVTTMAGMGVDIAAQKSKVLTDAMISNADIIVSVCSHADQNCPVIPGEKQKLHVPFDDPAALKGSESEILAGFERVSIEIKDAVSGLLNSLLNKRLNSVRGDVFDTQDVEILSRHRSHNGFVPIDVLKLKHRLFAGGWSEEMRRELAVRDPAVGVLLYDPQLDSVVMVKQFRTGVLPHEQSPWILEVVAGMAGAGEAPADVVKREAREEADCEITEMLLICEYLNSPGWSDEKISLYCARVDADSVGGIHGLDEEHEDILVVTMPLDDAIAAVATGAISNAMAIIALQWLQINRDAVKQRWCE